MSALSPPLQPSQAASPPFQRPISDEVFHLAPLLTLDHHTISPVYYSPIHPPDLTQHHHEIPRDHSVHPPASPHNPHHPEALDDISQPLEGSEDNSGDNDPPHHHNVSFPEPRSLTVPGRVADRLHSDTYALRNPMAHATLSLAHTTLEKPTFY